MFAVSKGDGPDRTTPNSSIGGFFFCHINVFVIAVMQPRQPIVAKSDDVNNDGGNFVPLSDVR